jgi:hypothetical protein
MEKWSKMEQKAGNKKMMRRPAFGSHFSVGAPAGRTSAHIT